MPLVQQPIQRADKVVKLTDKMSVERRNVEQQIDVIALAEDYAEVSRRKESKDDMVRKQTGSNEINERPKRNLIMVKPADVTFDFV